MRTTNLLRSLNRDLGGTSFRRFTVRFRWALSPAWGRAR